ncbi:MAG: carboxypeptidase M32, partial [Planctomycetota bacterium]
MQEKAYADFVAYLRETATLESCAGVLGWDRETNLPPGATELRANQLALLAGMVHERE